MPSRELRAIQAYSQGGGSRCLTRKMEVKVIRVLARQPPPQVQQDPVPAGIDHRGPQNAEKHHPAFAHGRQIKEYEYDGQPHYQEHYLRKVLHKLILSYYATSH